MRLGLRVSPPDFYCFSSWDNIPEKHVCLLSSLYSSVFLPPSPFLWVTLTCGCPWKPRGGTKQTHEDEAVVVVLRETNGLQISVMAMSLGSLPGSPGYCSCSLFHSKVFFFFFFFQYSWWCVLREIHKVSLRISHQIQLFQEYKPWKWKKLYLCSQCLRLAWVISELWRELFFGYPSYIFMW